MLSLRRVLLVAFLFALVTQANSRGATDSLVYAWGDTEKGLRLGVAIPDKEAPVRPASDILIAWKNTSDNDMLLDLGMMLDNGQKQYPTAFHLLLVKSDGTVQRLEYDGPGPVEGTIWPFMVPLLAHATYQIRFTLNSFILVPSIERVKSLHPGDYTLTATFEDQLDQDKGPLRKFWIGSVKSGTLAVKFDP